MSRTIWKQPGRRSRIDEDGYEDELRELGDDSIDHPGGSENPRGGRRWVHRPTCLSSAGRAASPVGCSL